MSGCQRHEIEHSLEPAESGYDAALTDPAGDSAIAVTTVILIILLGSAAGVAVLVYRRRQRLSESAPSAGTEVAPSEPSPPSNVVTDAPFFTEAIQAAHDEWYKLAFGVKSFDYEILGEHAAVLDRVSESAEESVHQREYFPRRPMLLPKLLQALNDTETSRRTLVNLIVADPALAGSVLQRANNAFYRTSREPVDSLDRAIQTLGTDGLRGLIAVAILQPIFRMPRGTFDSFADMTWEQAQRCATAAETHASVTRTADPFIAQLLGLLGPLARIVLFRLTMDMYREYPNVLPRAEVFIRSMQVHAPAVACRLAQSWELSDLATNALREQVDRVPPGQMGPLGRAAYFGELAGMVTLLAARDPKSWERAEALLIEQGLPARTARAVWNAAAELGRHGNR